MKKLDQILNTIEQTGAKCYFVGGCVRDKLLGIEVYDYDIEVYCIQFEVLVNTLKQFGELTVNEKFYTVKIKNYPNFEFAIARTETSVGKLHTDFKVKPVKNLDFNKACQRRDFTINSILMEYKTRNIIDIYNAKNDLNNKTIKHISDKFSEDPLRILRAIRFASKLAFDIDDETLKLCKSMTNNLNVISNERFSKEFEKLIATIHIEYGVKYFLLILSNYFSLDDVNENKLTMIKNCHNIRIRKCLFFYYLKTNNLQYLLSRCINKRQDIKDITLVLNSDLYNSMDFYNLAKHFNKQEIIDLYTNATTIDINNLYDYYENLKSKYNAQYFIDAGYNRQDISTLIINNICTKLDETL